MEAQSRPLMPGDPDLCGRFRVISRLGAGGMGIAYLAETTGGQRAVVKMVQLDHADDPDARRRFRHEVLASLSVESPFVPDTLASDLSAERQWVAIEYIDGPTLAELVARQGPLGPYQQYALASALAQGLTQLHAQGLVHRDVKPANIICTERGPRLIDFGIAVRENVSGSPGLGRWHQLLLGTWRQNNSTHSRSPRVPSMSSRGDVCAGSPHQEVRPLRARVRAKAFGDCVLGSPRPPEFRTPCTQRWLLQSRGRSVKNRPSAGAQRTLLESSEARVASRRKWWRRHGIPPRTSPLLATQRGHRRGLTLQRVLLFV